jgi:hypothetical protein
MHELTICVAEAAEDVYLAIEVKKVAMRVELRHRSMTILHFMILV